MTKQGMGGRREVAEVGSVEMCQPGAGMGGSQGVQGDRDGRSVGGCGGGGQLWVAGARVGRGASEGEWWAMQQTGFDLKATNLAAGSQSSLTSFLRVGVDGNEK